MERGETFDIEFKYAKLNLLLVKKINLIYNSMYIVSSTWNSNQP